MTVTPPMTVTPATLEYHWSITGATPEQHPDSRDKLSGARRRTGPRGRLGRGTACVGPIAHSATGAPAADTTHLSFLGYVCFFFLDGLLLFIFMVVVIHPSAAAGQLNSRKKPLPGRTRQK